MADGYRLRTYYRSSCSWRVRIALAFKGLEYASLPVHLVRDGGEQHGEAHRRTNAMSQVPVLMVGDTPVAQSMAILEFLEEVHPSPALLPTPPLARARARQLAEMVNSGIQPLQNLSVLQKLSREHEFDQTAVHAWCRHWIARGFTALERTLTDESMPSTGPYCLGSQVTYADVCLYPQLYNARRFAVDLTPYPTLLSIEEALAALPAFVGSHPSREPDAPADG